MADAKGSSFLLGHAEKAVVALLVLACGGYGGWTLKNLTPAGLDKLRSRQRTLVTKMANLPPTPEVEWHLPSVESITPRVAKVKPLDFDPFHPPKSYIVEKIYEIEPGKLIKLKEHIGKLVGTKYHLEVKVKKTQDSLLTVRDVKVTPIVEGPDRGTLVFGAANPDPKAQGLVTLAVRDVNNNEAIYTIIVTTDIPVAFPPTLVSVAADRRSATLAWEEDPRTTALVVGWRILRQAEGGQLIPVKDLASSLAKDAARYTGKPNKPKPGLDEYRYVDDSVQPSSSYTYAVCTLYMAGVGPVLTAPSKTQQVATMSDLSIKVTAINPAMVTFEVTKWVKDVPVVDAFNVRPGQRIGVRRSRKYPVGGENVEVDFTTPFLLVDIQPVRRLIRITKLVDVYTPDGGTEQRKVETKWWRSDFQAVVYNEHKQMQEIHTLRREKKGEK